MQKIFLLVCVLFWNCDSYASASSSSQEGTQEIKINNVMVTVSNEIVSLIEQHAGAIETQFNSDPAHHMICFDYRKLMYEIYCNVTTYVDVECVLLDPELFNSQPDTDRHLLYDNCMEYILEEFDKFLELYKSINFLFYVDDSFVQCFKKTPLDQSFQCCLGTINATKNNCFMFKTLENSFSQLCNQTFKTQSELPAYRHIKRYCELRCRCSKVDDQKLYDIIVKKLVALEQQHDTRACLVHDIKNLCQALNERGAYFPKAYNIYIKELAEQYGISNGLSAQYPESLAISCFVKDRILLKNVPNPLDNILQSMSVEMVAFQRDNKFPSEALERVRASALTRGGSVQAVESSSVTDPLIQSPDMSYAFIKSCTQKMFDENVPFPERKEALIVLHTALFNQKFNSYDSELPECKINFNYRGLLIRLFDNLKSDIDTISTIINIPTKVLSSLNIVNIRASCDNACMRIMCQALFDLYENMFDVLYQSKCLNLLTDDFMQCFQQLFNKAVLIRQSKSSMETRVQFYSKIFLHNCRNAINDQMKKPEYQHITQGLESAFDRSENASNLDKEAANPDKEIVNRLQKLILEFKSNINSKSSDKISFNCDVLISNLCSKMPEKIQEFFKASKFVLAKSAPKDLSELMNMSMVQVLDSVFMQVLNKENLMLIDDNFIQCINAELLTGCFVTMNLNGAKFDFGLNEEMFHANCIKAFENQMHHYEQYRVRCKTLSMFKRAGDDSSFDIAIKMLVGIEAVQNFKTIFDCNDLFKLCDETFLNYKKGDPSAYSSYIESLKKQYNLEHGLSDDYPKSFTISKSIIDKTKILSADKTRLFDLLKETLNTHNAKHRTIVQKLPEVRKNTALGSTEQGVQQVIQRSSDTLHLSSKSNISMINALLKECVQSIYEPGDSAIFDTQLDDFVRVHALTMNSLYDSSHHAFGMTCSQFIKNLCLNVLISSLHKLDLMELINKNNPIPQKVTVFGAQYFNIMHEVLDKFSEDVLTKLIQTRWLPFLDIDFICRCIVDGVTVVNNGSQSYTLGCNSNNLWPRIEHYLAELPNYNILIRYVELSDCKAAVTDEKLCNIIIKLLTAVEQKSPICFKFTSKDLLAIYQKVEQLKKNDVELYEKNLDLLAKSYHVDEVFSAVNPQSLKLEQCPITLQLTENYCERIYAYLEQELVPKSQIGAELSHLVLQLEEIQARGALQQEATDDFLNIMSNRSKPLGDELNSVTTELRKTKASLADKQNALKQATKTLADKSEENNTLKQKTEKIVGRNDSLNKAVEKLRTEISDISEKLKLSQTELETTNTAFQTAKTDVENNKNRLTDLQTSLQLSTANNAALLEVIKKTQAELEQEFTQSTESSVLQGQAESNVQSAQKALQQILERCKRVKTHSDEEKLAFSTEQNKLQGELQRSTTRFALQAVNITNLQVQLDNARNELTELEIRHPREIEEIERLNKENLENERSRLAAELSEAEAAHSNLEGRYSVIMREANEKLEELNKKLKLEMDLKKEKQTVVTTQTDVRTVVQSPSQGLSMLVHASNSAPRADLVAILAAATPRKSLQGTAIQRSDFLLRITQCGKSLKPPCAIGESESLKPSSAIETLSSARLKSPNAIKKPESLELSRPPFLGNLQPNARWGDVE